MPLNDLPSFKQFLAEDEKEDIIFGLRKLVTDIRSNWKTPYSAVKSEQLKNWKKLSSAQQENLKRIFNDLIHAMLTDISRPIPTAVFRPTTKVEAIAIPLTFFALAKGAKEVGQGIISSAQVRGHIDPKEAAQLEQQYDGSGDAPMDIPIGRNINAFIVQHRAKLTEIVSSYETIGFAFNVPKIINILIGAIEHKDTPPNRRAEAVRDIHYLFLKMASNLNVAGKQLETKFRGVSLPDAAQVPEKQPSPAPAPVTKP